MACMDKRSPYVLVTPYYKEPREVLERCLESVRRQTVVTDHIVVADGFPQDWVDDAGVRHIRLDRSHADFGNTPRSVGSTLAVSAGYEAIGFLDADCWLETNHVEHCLERARLDRRDCSFVAAKRILRRLDQSVMPIRDVGPDRFIDTNCYFMLPASYGVLPVWHLMPRELTVMGDQVFFMALKARRYRCALATKSTVNYTNTWAVSYRHLNEPPPEDAKENPDYSSIRRWMNGLSRQDTLDINARLGIDIHTLLKI
jgi:glycosyltransferase involved in cell wall biosynthesis